MSTLVEEASVEVRLEAVLLEWVVDFLKRKDGYKRVTNAVVQITLQGTVTPKVSNVMPVESLKAISYLLDLC
jgi:hypothetical protein